MLATIGSSLAVSFVVVIILCRSGESNVGGIDLDIWKRGLFVWCLDDTAISCPFPKEGLIRVLHDTGITPCEE